MHVHCRVAQGAHPKKKKFRCAFHIWNLLSPDSPTHLICAPWGWARARRSPWPFWGVGSCPLARAEHRKNKQERKKQKKRQKKKSKKQASNPDPDLLLLPRVPSSSHEILHASCPRSKNQSRNLRLQNRLLKVIASTQPLTASCSYPCLKTGRNLHI